MKKILICSHYFYPDLTPRAFRATSLADYFSENGYEVDIMYGKEKKIFKNYNINFKQKNKVNNMLLMKEWNPGKVRKIISKIAVFTFGETELIKKSNMSYFESIGDINQYQFILSIGQPFYTHFFISKLIRKYNWKGVSISDWGDPFYSNPGYSKMGIHLKILQKNIMSIFDYVSIPIEAAIPYYSEFVTKERLKVIPQGFDLKVKEIECVDLVMYEEVPTFIYAGAFYEEIRNPENILKFLKSLDQPFKFIIFTDKSDFLYKKVVEPFVSEMNGKIIVYDKISREKLIGYMKKSDFLLNIENKGDIQQPSKLIDFGISQKPILSIKPDDKEGLMKIKQFLNGNYEDSEIIDIQKYDIEIVANEFLKLFEK
ncbi:hypothetical protein ACN9KL_09155 [Vagococcus fluvialis]|uniref:hypothetical protein n=1 Tax=Vagococcus fluvialis TaxID=2738 RepID=UPI003B22323B